MATGLHSVTSRIVRAAATALLWSLALDASAQTVRYIHTDALGSVAVVTDQNRNVIERREYEPYGFQLTPVIKDGPGYTGHVQDATTGLTYMQQRYYDPQIGRFLSVDPVTADPVSGANFNRYKYGANNPYGYTDPDGRIELPTVQRLIDSANSFAVQQVSSAATKVIDASIEEGRKSYQQARAYISQRDIVIALGYTGMVGGGTPGMTNPVQPGIHSSVNVSAVVNISSGQIGLQGSFSLMPGLGGGAILSPEAGLGLSNGVLTSGLSVSNTAFAQAEGVVINGVPVNAGISANWSQDGGSASIGVRGTRTGSYLGAGSGKTWTGTWVTDPYWGGSQDEDTP